MEHHRHNLLILDIVMAIRDEFGVDTRPGAEAALAEWKHNDQLTEQERAAVLARFPASQVIDLTFDEGGWLEQQLDQLHEKYCMLNGEGSGDYYRDDIAKCEAIIGKLA